MFTQGTKLTASWIPHPSSLPLASEPDIPTAIACSNVLVASGLQQILSGTSFVVVEGGSPAGPTPFASSSQKPSLLIIEESEDVRRIAEVVGRVRMQSPKARIVVVAEQFDLSFVRLACEAGVDGFCSIASDPEVLIKSLELVMLGEVVLPSSLIRSILKRTSQDPEPRAAGSRMAEANPIDLKAYNLSPRETDILGCLKEGVANKIIARKFDLSEATVKVHVKAILRKIGAANRTQAALWATAHLPTRGMPQHV